MGEGLRALNIKRLHIKQLHDYTIKRLHNDFHKFYQKNHIFAGDAKI